MTSPFARFALFGCTLLMSCSLLLNSDEPTCAGRSDCTSASQAIATTTADAGTTSPCKQRCKGDTPVCDPSSGQCVQCMRNDQCADQQPVALCDPSVHRCIDCWVSDDCAGMPGREHCTDTHECVRCLANSHCPAGVCAADFTCIGCLQDKDCEDPRNSHCDVATRTCGKCRSDGECAHVSDAKNLCEQGQCVECTPQMEERCNGMVCNPKSHACTRLPRGMTKVCASCSFDSECPNGQQPLAAQDHVCVPMDFKGEPHGSYCMKLAASGCERPYTVVTATTSSGAGGAATSFCGIDQMNTTCEAVLDASKGTECDPVAKMLCGDRALADDAVCLPTAANRTLCTYPCTGEMQCPEGMSCADDMYCE